MKRSTSIATVNRPAALGFTLTEVMVATLLGSLILAVIATLSIYGMRSFVATSNYIDLDSKSRRAADEISTNLRDALGLISVTADSTVRQLVFTTPGGGTNAITWNIAARTLTSTENGIVKTNLTECDSWSYELFARAPLQNTTNKFLAFQGGVNQCKLVSMTWRCSRTLLGKKWNTETVQTTKIVLRNAK